MAETTISRTLVVKAFEVGKPIKATVQRYDTVQLTVTLQDAGGDIVDLTDCSLIVSTIDLTGVTLWEATATDAANGIFTVIFQPKCLGRIDIRVMVTTSEGAVTTFFIGSLSIAVEDKEISVDGTIRAYTEELTTVLGDAETVTDAAKTAVTSAQAAADAANAAAESAAEAAETAKTAAEEANELAAAAQTVVDNASSVAEAAQTAATEAAQTVSQLQDDINEAVTTAQEAAESAENAAALIGSAVVDIAAADGVLTVTKADGQSSDIEVGTPVTIASDTEVEEMLTEVFA